MSDPALLRIPKNATEEVRVELSEYKSHQLLNLRVWWTPDDGKTWHPSKRGFALHVDARPDLLTGLTALEAEAQRLGWLEDAGESGGARDGSAHGHRSAEPPPAQPVHNRVRRST